MSEPEVILKLIETADPANPAQLDEIDARVWCYVGPHVGASDFLGIIRERDELPKIEYEYRAGTGFPEYRRSTYKLKDIPKYSASRDALKMIRPLPRGEWWSWEIDVYDAGSWIKLTRSRDFGSRRFGPFPSEELAELYAIIQAMAHERGGA